MQGLVQRERREDFAACSLAEQAEQGHKGVAHCLFLSQPTPYLRAVDFLSPIEAAEDL